MGSEQGPGEVGGADTAELSHRQAASGDRQRRGRWKEPVGEKRKREADPDAVSFSSNLHGITGLGLIPPGDCRRGGRRLGEERNGQEEREHETSRHTERFNSPSAWRTSEHRSLGMGSGPVKQKLFPLRSPRRRCQAPRGCSEPWAERLERGLAIQAGVTTKPTPPCPGSGRQGKSRWVLASRHRSQPALPGYCPHGHSRARLPRPAYPLPLQPGLESEEGWEQLCTRQKDGQGAKTCPRKRSSGLFSPAGGGPSGLHSPWRQSQDSERA